MTARSIAALVLAGATTAAAGAEPLLRLPTANDNLFRGKPEAFYQYVERVFEGATTKPWTGGQFGFVRNPARWNGKLIQTKFHEGIDIKPVARDARGVPLDPVRAVAAGVVRHASDVPGHSDYGRYVVIEHDWGEGPVFSLYAHLQRIDVQAGVAVKAGDPIGLLGFTGVGINLERAHLHLEIGLLLHSRFPQWHDKLLAGTNHHGIYNGLNLAGIDPAALYRQQRRGGSITLPGFVRARPVAWKAVVPAGTAFELPGRYPWLLESRLGGAPGAEIAFARSGLPVSIRPSRLAVARPVLVWVAPTDLPITVLTNHCVTRNKGVDRLTASGTRFLDLIAGTF